MAAFALADRVAVVLVALTLAYDVLCRIPWPKPIQRAWRTLHAPFRNFLTLEDLAEPVGDRVHESRLKTISVVGVAIIQGGGFLGYFAYACAAGDGDGMGWLLVSLAWIYTALRLTLQPPSTPPYLSLTFALLQCIWPLVELFIDLVRAGTRSSLYVSASLRIVAPVIFVSILSSLPVAPIVPARNVAGTKDVSSSSLSCPEDKVTLFEWSTFTFVEPLLSAADKGRLNDEDVWQLSPYFKHKNLFNKYLEYRTQHPTHSLIRFLLVSNSLDLILDIVMELWASTVGFVPPYALKEILAVLSDPTSEARSTAYFWTLIVFVAHLSFAQVDLFQGWHQRRCYERTRGQLFCALHYKSLVREDMSGKVKEKEAGQDEPDNANLGRIVNLMQGDSYAVAQRFWEFNGIFMAPIRLTIALVFLYQILGWSALSGVVVVLVAYIVTYPLARYNVFVTRESWKAKDGRMERVNELLQNIRFLKFFGWEYKWASTASIARERELGWRVKENIIDTAISFIWTWIPSATALTSFLCYTLIAGERLTVSKAFTALALFSQLQEPMTALPGQFFALLHAYVSMQRIEAFLAEDEVPKWASTLTNTEEPSTDGIGFNSAVFEWQVPPKTVVEGTRFRLGPVNTLFPEGKLTLVSGATGSGKTALLSGLLGEMHCIEGRVLLNKSHHHIAYCAQNPWLEHATIRDNIVFNSAFGYDEERYQAVIEACALVHDLTILEAGDMTGNTEIGERGVTLSGGQRARIALARAFYSQAKCILLDDPLAAVDMHTASHIVEHCLRGRFARDRTIILVTHHVSICSPVAHYIIELADGRVLREGTIKSFEENGTLQKVVEMEDQGGLGQSIVVMEPVKKAPANGKLIEVEARAEGRVSMRTYMTYVRAAGVWSWIVTLLLMLLIRVINISNQIFLASWGEAYEKSYLRAVITAGGWTLPWSNLPSPDVDVKPWLMVYLYISLLGAFSVVFYLGLGYYASLQASRALFRSLLSRLTRAPARFFDVTPIGRILNRFTTDINTVDGALQNSARQCLSGVLNFVASFCVILAVVPTFAPFALFIAWLYVRLAPSYVRASRDLRRLESVSLSPAFAGFDELLRGITHVRAFGMERIYQDRFYTKVDKFQTFDHVYWLVSGWLRWRYDCLGSLVVFATTIFALWMGVSDGAAAIVIVQAGIFAEASRQLVRVAAQLELDFNSVERIVEYLEVPQEAPAIVEKNRPPAYWPSDSGDVVVEDLEVRYAPDLPSVLRKVSFRISPSEKIGVVGRTGSGKSTLALSLLRMVEPIAGRILQYRRGGHLSNRSRRSANESLQTIVSQDVSLFSGTIRSNLDPLGLSSDQECLDVLDRCHITALLKQHDSGSEQSLLDMPVSAGSLSAGERQLLALSRAILRRTNIIIMDEATSQIDSELDDQIQRTIREELSSAIVLTIAHRLKTIIDYDRILVLADGQLVEFGTPQDLLRSQGGLFRDMCRKSPDWPLFASIAGHEPPEFFSTAMPFRLRWYLFLAVHSLVIAGPLHHARNDMGGLGGLFGDESYSTSNDPTIATDTLDLSTPRRHPHLPEKTANGIGELLGTGLFGISSSTTIPSITPTSLGLLPTSTNSQITETGRSDSSASQAPSSTTTSAQTTTASDPVLPASGASDVAKWKVVGIATLGAVVVSAVLLAIVYFDTWYGTLLALFGKQHDFGKEEMVPDWAKGEWEFKIASEDGHRYPTMSSLESMTKKDLASPVPNAAPASPHPAHLGPLARLSMYLPSFDPHPLDPLFRRPSASKRSIRDR
ncbi:unnamed protein product [Mycena citricolor]|uniref:Pleiotropic drug resistance ABC transporter n=1 Tax=Mycena citricolor TaxID=2018698 RepID=A0AAD2HQJ9_9AGAR|nr:unnamed protein product [Mycena citricolor]